MIRAARWSSLTQAAWFARRYMAWGQVATARMLVKQITRLTCSECTFALRGCCSAWDEYNTDGDCLELK